MRLPRILASSNWLESNSVDPEVDGIVGKTGAGRAGFACGTEPIGARSAHGGIFRLTYAHRHHDAGSVTCGVITVSDSRTEENDTSGQLTQRLLREAGHAIELYRIVRDEPRLILNAIESAPGTTQAIICTGGTGLAKRDSTYEAISRLLEKEITGFGELFRMLSYEQIGAAAILSRATAGVAGQRIVFSLPGSTAAVELAMTKLILPELRHMVGLIRQP